MKKIAEFRIVDHGVDHPQYFEGHGVAFPRFTDCATGVGDTHCAALKDALEQLAIEWDVSAIEVDDMRALEPNAHDDCPAEDDDCELHWYVSVDVREEKSEEKSKASIFVTFEEIDPDHDTEANPDVTRRGYVSEGYDIKLPEGLVGSAFVEWRDREVRPVLMAEYGSGTTVDKAVRFLQHGGFLEGSESGPGACPRWYSTEGATDFRSGVYRQETAHLNGFSDAELHEVYQRLKSRD